MHGALTLMTREIYYGLQSNEANGFTAFVRNTIADTGMKHISCLSLWMRSLATADNGVNTIFI